MKVTIFHSKAVKSLGQNILKISEVLQVTENMIMPNSVMLLFYIIIFITYYYFVCC